MWELNVPLLPGTLTMYNSNGSCVFCVGFRGYAGGFEAMVVIDDNERASTGPGIGFDGMDNEGESSTSPELALAISEGGSSKGVGGWLHSSVPVGGDK